MIRRFLAAVAIVLFGLYMLNDDEKSVETKKEYTPAKQKTVPAHQGPKRYAVASWYGQPFHGRTMANGRRYNMHDPHVVAHKSLPFGTKVKFTNPKTGESIVAVVQDRGPYIHGREFDLSYEAARRLGTTKVGVARLQVERI